MNTFEKKRGVHARIDAEIRRRRDDLTRLEKYMPHRDKSTQRRALNTHAQLTNELAELAAMRVSS